LTGDLPGAIAYLRESLERLRIVGDKRRLCRTLYLFGMVVAAGGAPDRALRLFAAALAHAPNGAPLDPGERAGGEAALTAARAALGQEAIAQAWADGQAMTLEQAVAYALEEDGR
jgi:hypothetical protein